MRATADLPLQLALVLLGAALYLPFLADPLGVQEINAGYFFGPFAASYERFGFFALRGVPLGTLEFLPTDPVQGIPYLNHPPGVAWLCCTLASAEWRMRLPSALAAIGTGLLLYRLLRARMPRLAAAFAGLLAMAVPAMTFYSQLSYEAIVVCCGVALWCAFRESNDGSRRARNALVIAAVLGPWLNWDFGFFVLALPLLAPRGTLGSLVRRLLLPWSCALASLGLVLLWVLWARSAPFMAVPRSFEHPHDYLTRHTLFAFPPLGDFTAGLWAQLQLAYTAPLLLAAAAGLLWLARAQPRLGLALVLPWLLNVLVFPAHACSHTMFMTLLAPAVAGGCATLLANAWRAGAGRVPVALAAALLLGFTVATSLDRVRQHRSPLLREVGAALTAAAEVPDERGRSSVVGTNSYHCYPYYVRSDRVYLWPVTESGALERFRGNLRRDDKSRLRFLLLEPDVYTAKGELLPGPMSRAATAPLAEYLKAFPSHRIASLERSWPLADGYRIEIARATLYDL